MKRALIIALMLIGMISMGQTVIIGDSIMGGVPIPFADTILSVDCDSDGESYYIDLNEDEIDNIRVFLDCYMGGTGTKAYIGFQAFDNFYLQVDTNFITTFQNWDEETDSIITWEDKYTIPKPYYDGDTINLEQASSQVLRYIVEIVHWDDIPVEIIDVDDFIGDTLHIVFREDADKQIYYHIQLHVISISSIRMMSAWSTATIGLETIPKKPPKVLHIEYFDLMGRQIPKPSLGFYIERKVTDKGVISTKHYIQ